MSAKLRDLAEHATRMAAADERTLAGLHREHDALPADTTDRTTVAGWISRLTARRALWLQIAHEIEAHLNTTSTPATDPAQLTIEELA